MLSFSDRLSALLKSFSVRKKHYPDLNFGSKNVLRKSEHRQYFFKKIKCFLPGDYFCCMYHIAKCTLGHRSAVYSYRSRSKRRWRRNVSQQPNLAPLGHNNSKLSPTLQCVYCYSVTIHQQRTWSVYLAANNLLGVSS